MVSHRAGVTCPRLTWPAAAAFGLLLDRALGEPPAALHPVAWFGRAMLLAERADYRDSRAAGALHAALGVLAGAGAGAFLRSAVLGTWVAAAGRSLGESALTVARALECDDLPAARAALPALVGRDPTGLDEGEMARAVVESVAENTVDALVAPAFWAAVCGAPGVLGYRAVNTLDAMVGHRSTRYHAYGWASARLDDVAGYLPARLTAALVAGVRPGRAAAVWRAVRSQAPDHPSPNAGVAEAAFAAALGLRLGGCNRYGDRVEWRPWLGQGRPAARLDIQAAVRLSSDVGWLLTAILAAAGLAGAPVKRLAGGARDAPPGAAGPARLDEALKCTRLTQIREAGQ
jgi:adenosylcobinamide-phosphate synthase